MAGAEIQADAIQTVLDGFPLRPAPWWLNALFVIVLGALTPLIALRFKMGLAIAATTLPEGLGGRSGSKALDRLAASERRYADRAREATASTPDPEIRPT